MKDHSSAGRSSDQPGTAETRSRLAGNQEHPLWVELAKEKVVPLYGPNYKDKRADSMAWLQRYGDPYVLSVSDTQGRIGIDYGVHIVHDWREQTGRFRTARNPNAGGRVTRHQVG